MARSRVKELPPDIKAMVDRLLVQGRESQLAILAKVNEMLGDRGEQPLSRSGFNRYALTAERIGARVRQAREVADLWVGKLGEMPDGKVGRWLIETIRIMAYESTTTLAEGDEPIPPKVLNELAKMARNLELAEKTNAERELEVIKRIREEDRAKLDELEREASAESGGGDMLAALEKVRQYLGVR
ncbi:MAG: DUF3486 family protein [Magnetospirillum sp.]|nr:DUF3486 family protein [Magnetospirillum sp.]